MRGENSSSRATILVNPCTVHARWVRGSVRWESMPSWRTMASGAKARRSGGTTASEAGGDTAAFGEGWGGRVEEEPGPPPPPHSSTKAVAGERRAPRPLLGE